MSGDREAALWRDMIRTGQGLVDNACLLVDNLRLLHPDLYGDGPERWPDGRVVVYDQTLEPNDFKPAGDHE